MSARAAQITVLSLIVLFAIVVLGFNSYITWAFYGMYPWKVCRWFSATCEVETVRARRWLTVPVAFALVACDR